MEMKRSFQRSWIPNPAMLLGLIAMVATFMLGGVGVVAARTLILPDPGPYVLAAPTAQTNPTATVLPREPATHRTGPQLVA